MTNQEADHYLRKLQDMITNGVKVGKTQKENVQFCEAIGVALYAIQYAKKAIPKEPILRGENDYPYCPNRICNHRLAERTRYKHCPDCGQRLDWENMYK